MSEKTPSDQDNLENDPVWDLLSRDAARHPVTPSPWFAARTAALTKTRRRAFPTLIRWLLPVPLAALGALVMLLLHGGHGLGIIGSTGSYVSSEAEFEQHMELLYASIE